MENRNNLLIILFFIIVSTQVQAQWLWKFEQRTYFQRDTIKIEYMADEYKGLSWTLYNMNSGQEYNSINVDPEFIVNEPGFYGLKLEVKTKVGIQKYKSRHEILVAPKVNFTKVELHQNYTKISTNGNYIISGNYKEKTINFIDLENSIIFFKDFVLDGNGKQKPLRFKNLKNCIIIAQNSRISNFKTWGLDATGLLQDVVFSGFKFVDSNFAAVAYKPYELDHKRLRKRENSKDNPRNIAFFDFKLKNIESEGFYINHNNGWKSDRGYPPIIENLLVSRTIASRIGGDLVQWSATKNAEISYNISSEQTIKPTYRANNVFCAAERSDGWVHHNIITGAEGYFITAKNTEKLLVENNYSKYNGQEERHAILIPNFNSEIPEKNYKNHQLVLRNNYLFGWDGIIQVNNNSPGYPVDVQLCENLFYKEYGDYCEIGPETNIQNKIIE